MRTNAYSVCTFSTDTFQFPLLYSYPCFPFYLFCVSLAGIWIFITCGGRIQNEIYDVLLTNPSREVAWRKIVYLRMHTRSIGRQNKNKIYILQRCDKFGSSFVSLILLITINFCVNFLVNNALCITFQVICQRTWQ